MAEANSITGTNVVLADHFLKSLGTLTREEQARVYDAVFAFIQNPRHPGLSLHRLDKVKTKGFWSIRVSLDLRMILYQHPEGLWVLAYVGHHDDAYRWAETHQVEVHPRTRMLQIYRTVEREILVMREVKPLLGHYSEDYLLELGVPEIYLKPLRQVETEEQLVEVIEGLPQDVQERLLDLATGKVVSPPPKLSTLEELSQHPVSRQHFLFFRNLTELRQALTYPWEKWLTFLHPAQREAVDRTFQGPARVTGPAGTGKTVVVLHRVKTLVERYPGEPILLTTFNRFLAAYLRRGLETLLGEVPAQVTVENLHSLAHRWHNEHIGPVQIATEEEYVPWLEEAAQGLGYERAFLLSEFALVDAWGLYTWESYRGFPRTGQGVPLSARERLRLFQAFQKVWQRLEAEGKQTFGGLLHRLQEKGEAGELPRFRAVVVDEAQDLGPAELMWIKTLAHEAPDNLFFALDAAQRIYKNPLSWQALGLEIRGRSIRLKVNYRTTREIARVAESVLPQQVEEEMRDVLSLLKGPAPEIRGFKDQEACALEAVRWVRWLLDQGLRPSEIAVLARSKRLASDLAGVLEEEGLPTAPLSDKEESGEGILYGSVHGAKGREFKAVVVFGANRNLFPLERLVREASSERDREAAVDKERNLLYVALSRARERVWVGYWGEPSPFLGPQN